MKKLLLAALALSTIFVWLLKEKLDTTRHELPQMTSADGPVLRKEVLSRVFEITRRYKSMEGPWETQILRLNSDKNEIIWLKGIQTEIVDPTNIKSVSQDFMCHLNFDLVPREHEKYFKDFTPGSSRIVTLSMGLMRYQFPDGYAIPFHSKEDLSITMQVLNHNLNGNYFVRHRVSFFFILDSELKQPIKPLFFNSGYVMKQLNGPAGYFNEPLGQQASCPCCSQPELGENAPQFKAMPGFTDGMGRVFSGHWSVPQGQKSSWTPLSTYMSLPYPTELVGIVPHVHPFAKEVRIWESDEACKKNVFFESKVTNPFWGTGLKKIDSFSRNPGLEYNTKKTYDIEVVYNNTSDQVQDSMATLLLFFEDKRFKKPDESLWPISSLPFIKTLTRGDSGGLSCGLPVPDKTGVSAALSPQNILRVEPH